MTHKITGGIVSIEDGVKAKEEFAPARKVRVELHFDVPEGADHQAHIDGVSALAHAKVNELLSGKVAPAPKAAETKAPTTTAARTDKDVLAAKAGVDAGSVAQAAALAAAKAASKRAPRKKAEEPEAPPADADELATADAAVVAPEAAQTDIEDELFTSDAEEISDQTLHDKIGHKNGAIENAVAIKKLIGSYNPDPTKQFSAKQIPQDQRAGFLAALDKLTKDSK